MANLNWQHKCNVDGREGHYLKATSGNPHASVYVVQQSTNGRYWWLYVNGMAVFGTCPSLWAALLAADNIEKCKCPGCGCEPGEGRTTGCGHPEGCGYSG